MIVDSEWPCEHAQRLLAFRRPKNGHVTQRASASRSAGSFPRERMKIGSCNEPPCAILQPGNDFQQATCPLAQCAPALRRVGIGPAHLHHSRAEECFSSEIPGHVTEATPGLLADPGTCTRDRREAATALAVRTPTHRSPWAGSPRQARLALRFTCRVG